MTIDTDSSLVIEISWQFPYPILCPFDFCVLEVCLRLVCSTTFTVMIFFPPQNDMKTVGRDKLRMLIGVPQAKKGEVITFFSPHVWIPAISYKFLIMALILLRRPSGMVLLVLIKTRWSMLLWVCNHGGYLCNHNDQRWQRCHTAPSLYGYLDVILSNRSRLQFIGWRKSLWEIAKGVRRSNPDT